MTAVVASSDSESCFFRYRSVLNHLGRRARYADKVIVLDSKGQIEETGTSDDLKVILSNEGLRKPEKLEKSETDNNAAQSEPTALQLSKIETEGKDAPTDITRQVGNRAVYKFYANAVGWASLIIFVLALCGYAFFSSFPSEYYRYSSSEALLTLTPGQISG